MKPEFWRIRQKSEHRFPPCLHAELPTTCYNHSIVTYKCQYSWRVWTSPVRGRDCMYRLLWHDIWRLPHLAAQLKLCGQLYRATQEWMADNLKIRLFFEFRQMSQYLCCMSGITTYVFKRVTITQGKCWNGWIWRHVLSTVLSEWPIRLLCMPRGPLPWLLRNVWWPGSTLRITLCWRIQLIAVMFMFMSSILNRVTLFIPWHHISLYWGDI